MNTAYSVSCNLQFIREPAINNNAIYEFKTSAPPVNGTVSIFPDYGYIGDSYLILVDGFRDPNSLKVLYNVYAT
jgi:hypothetical protein